MNKPKDDDVVEPTHPVVKAFVSNSNGLPMWLVIPWLVFVGSLLGFFLTYRG